MQLINILIHARGLHQITDYTYMYNSYTHTNKIPHIKHTQTAHMHSIKKQLYMQNTAIIVQSTSTKMTVYHSGGT